MEISNQETIPADRLKGAEAFGTWGGHMWQDFYARTPLEWADSEIRGFNADLRQDTGNVELIQKRDICYQWRNAYLREYNSAFPTRPVDSQLDSRFGKLLKDKIATVYQTDDTKREAVLGAYQAFIDDRKRTIEFKNLPSSESGLVGEMK